MIWDKKPQVIKGNIGEQIVRKHLELAGKVIYTPDTNGPHVFDFLTFDGKVNPVVYEVKTKARMNKWYATGIDYRHWSQYMKIYADNRIDTFLAFVDEYEKKVYGQFISNLRKLYRDKSNTVYPKVIKQKKGGDLIIFSLELMDDIHHLTDDQVTQLRLSSTRSYDYN